MEKLNKLIKYHFSYLFTRTTIVILVVATAIVFFFNLFTVLSFDNRISNDGKLYDYYMSSFTIIKLLSILFIIFLFGYSFTSSNDEYRAITINKNINRNFYFVSKVITLSFVYIFFDLLLVAITMVIALSFNVVFTKTMIASLFILCLNNFHYGFLAILLVLIFDNVYIIFLIFPFSLIEYNDSTKFLCFLMPLNYNNDLLIVESWRFSCLYYVFINIIFFTILLSLWNKLDLQN